MPRHNRQNTPPEKRRAPKGSLVGRQTVRHTAASVQHFEALRARWGLSQDETVREALRRCAESNNDANLRVMSK